MLKIICIRKLKKSISEMDSINSRKEFDKWIKNEKNLLRRIYGINSRESIEFNLPIYPGWMDESLEEYKSRVKSNVIKIIENIESDGVQKTSDQMQRDSHTVTIIVGIVTIIVGVIGLILG